MPRKPRPLDRVSGVLRDANLIVIASEDTYAVEKYFRRFKTRRVQFDSIPTKDCRSSPPAVFERLKAAKAKYEQIEGDSYWLCVDRDSWKEHAFEEVVHQASRQNYGVAISDPCFEIWILLHFEDLPSTFSNCGEVVKHLQSRIGGYTKQCCQIMDLKEQQVHDAMTRARALDAATGPGNKTEVYKILDELLKRDSIQLS